MSRHLGRRSSPLDDSGHMVIQSPHVRNGVSWARLSRSSSPARCRPWRFSRSVVLRAADRGCRASTADQATALNASRRGLDDPDGGTHRTYRSRCAVALAAHFANARPRAAALRRSGRSTTVRAPAHWRFRATARAVPGNAPVRRRPSHLRELVPAHASAGGKVLLGHRDLARSVLELRSRGHGPHDHGPEGCSRPSRERGARVHGDGGTARPEGIASPAGPSGEVSPR